MILPPPEKFDPIYAAIIGALIAMASGLISALVIGLQARSRQKVELAHSATQKELDRQHTSVQKELERVYALKREVYLPFVDAMAGAVAFLPSIPVCPSDILSAMQPIAELGRHFARVTHIAPPSVLDPVMRSFLHIQSIMNVLVARRRAIDDAKGLRDQTMERVHLMLERQKVLGARMEALNESGEYKPQLAMVYAEHTDLGTQINNALSEHESQNHHLAELNLEAFELTQELLAPIQQHTIPSIVAVRAEMGLPIDEIWYREFTGRTAQDAMQSIQSFLKELRHDMLGKNA